MLRDRRSTRRRSPFAGLILLPALLAALGLTAARAEDPPATPAADRALEARLRALEEANRRLLEQYDELRRRDEEARREADARYRELEGRYEELLDRIEPGPAPAAGREHQARPEGPIEPRPGEPRGGGHRFEPPDREEWTAPLRARFDDGFLLETLDEEVTLRLHVLNQVDFKDFVPNDMSPARSGLYIPRVRVYFEGRLTRPFEYEVSLQRSVEGIWDLLDANLNIRPSEAFQVQFGRMLVPYSYDWYDHLEQYFITPERGLFPLNFGLSRSAGLMAHGYLFDRRLQYAVGGFDGRVAGVADNNTTRDAVAYANFRPFLQSERYPGLRYLNVGGSIFGGQQIVATDPLPLRTSVQSSENDEAARAASATFLEFNEGVSPLGRRAAGALHLAWYVRQLSLEAEWQTGSFQFARRGLRDRPVVPVTGYHVTLGYFLTGEEVEGRTTVEPLRPWRPGRATSGLGAVELFARYSQLDIADTVFSAGLADPEESTRRVYMTDLGLNWYPNRFVKFYFDWQLPFYASPVLVNPGTDLYRRDASLFWIRCQIYY